MSDSVKKRAFTLVDLMKLLLALLILVSHYVNEHASGQLPKLIDLSVSIYIIAVPAFFSFSGYFLFSKIYHSEKKKHRKIINSYVLKIMRLYGVWSSVYIIFNILTWFRFGIDTDTLFAYIHRAVVYSTYNTIWFLPATVVGAIMAYAIWKKIGSRSLMVFAVIFCILGALGDSYSPLTEKIPVISQLLHGYKMIFITTRNGLFNGFPYITIGAILADISKESKVTDKSYLNIYFGMSLIFGAIFVAEAVFVKIVLKSSNANTILMLFPFTYCFTKWLVTCKQPTISERFSIGCRNLSTLIFVSQRLFLSALPALFPGSFFTICLDEHGAMIGLCWLIGATIALSVLIIISSKHIRLFKIFY